MKAGILWGETKHARLEPVRHEFRYPLFYFVLDVAQLESFPSTLLYGINRRAFFSIREEDYLGPERGAIAERLRQLLAAHGFTWRDEPALLVTMPRVLGYIFNPVSFYGIFSADNRLAAMVCEVNNTFGEKHLYVHVPPEPQALPYSFELTKEFYVSPFFDTTGRYVVSVRWDDAGLDIGIVLHKERPVFWANLAGELRAFSTAALVGSVVRFPLTAFLTMARIHRHAVVLRLQKLIPWMKPEPLSPRTVRSQPRLIHRLRLGIIALWRRGAEKAGPPNTTQS